MKPLQTQFSRSDNKNAADGFFCFYIRKKRKRFLSVKDSKELLFLCFNNPFDTKNTCCSCVDVSLYYLH